MKQSWPLELAQVTHGCAASERRVGPGAPSALCWKHHPLCDTMLPPHIIQLQLKKSLHFVQFHLDASQWALLLCRQENCDTIGGITFQAYCFRASSESSFLPACQVLGSVVFPRMGLPRNMTREEKLFGISDAKSWAHVPINKRSQKQTLGTHGQEIEKEGQSCSSRTTATRQWQEVNRFSRTPLFRQQPAQPFSFLSLLCDISHKAV